MTAEQQAAHARMQTYLPRRTHLKIMSDEKHAAILEAENSHNKKLMRSVQVGTKVYPSVASALKGEKIAATKLYKLMSKGFARYIGPPRLLGTQNSNSSISSERKTARTRGRND